MRGGKVRVLEERRRRGSVAVAMAATDEWSDKAKGGFGRKRREG